MPIIKPKHEARAGLLDCGREERHTWRTLLVSCLGRSQPDCLRIPQRRGVATCIGDCQA